ncbi:MAG: hypothetical protein UY05_C0018G0003 [Candidatus Peregrinibacteria bacterium GW2011_GWA2_47_7]|nr:MAG: hypothetical protein UY05_C0018G0003 [Candidatus Peregrinibacteria bacterium GW2011_GWA2_47_7]
MKPHKRALPGRNFIYFHTDRPPILSIHFLNILSDTILYAHALERPAYHNHVNYAPGKK